MVEPIRFFVEDILSGQIKTADMAFDDWAYDDTLNRPGTLSATVPLTSDYCTEELLDPWRTAIYAVRGTRVEWGGILAPPSLPVGARSLTVGAFGWLGYWDRRTIRGTVGQPEPGGVIVARPNADDTVVDLFGLPNRDDMWQNLAGGYGPQQGVICDPTLGNPSYRARFAIPTLGTLHPIASVTLNIVATRIAADRVLTPWVKIGSNSYSGTPTAVSGTPYAPTNCSYTWTTNPDTGIAWTVSDVEDFASSSSAGFSFDSTTTGYDAAVNQLSLTIKYEAGYSDYFTQTDQFDIFRSLVLDAQSIEKFGVGWDLGIDVTWDTLSGVLRDRVAAYRPANAKNLGEALRQLAAVENGFDFAMEYTLNPATDRIDKVIRLHYPSKGRDTGFLFEYDPGAGPDHPRRSNVLQRGFADPVNFAWAGDGWGTGNDDTRLKSSYVDETLRGVYPPYDAAPSWSTVVEQSTLDEHTDAAFARSNRPKRVPVLRVDPDMDPQWGSYDLGDTVHVRTIDGYGSTGPTPETVRTTGWKVTSDDTYDLVLADPIDTTSTEDA